ncbi:RimK family alpha-L-glutamate ligase [Gracilibacillus sp. YIM 98692]|uniref:ATP-grasp domain-containing protein n=1 Tax=Gracilibacillus sp. YIM 98692 TaxID=2663532 RepID=UPI0013D63B57|nr:RimK family alpha-L-glutamate ligase [Gracilibacillus sp. YIM 98692]
MQGWVIHNGHLSSTRFLQFPKAIQEASLKRKVGMSLMTNDTCTSMVSDQGIQLDSSVDSKLPDFVIFNDKDIALARQLEMLGIPLYNNAEAIDLCDNKVYMYQQLAKERLPIPKTILAPKVFTKVETHRMEHFLSIAKKLGFPLVIKEGYGSFGEQVHLVHDQKDCTAIIQQMENRPFLFQEYVESSYGRDIRIFVVGHRVVAALKRYSVNDFRANVHQGSAVEEYIPTEAEKELALNATSAVQATYAGVDLLFGPNNQPIICEVNTNAHIGTIYRHTGVNVADHIIDYIIHDLTTKKHT